MSKPDSFSKKLGDYNTYVADAAACLTAGRFADAALNARRAGEAACKVLLYFRFSEKAASEKIYGKNLKELIIQVIRDNAAERAAINHLETVQITGNRAAHDSDEPVTRDEAELAVRALWLLTDWLYVVKLRAAVPSQLNERRAPIPEIKTIVLEKIIEKEADPAVKDRLMAEFRTLAEEERTRYAALAKEETERLLEEVSSRTRANESRAEPQSPAPAAAGKKSLRVYLWSAAALVAVSLVFLLLRAGSDDALPPENHSNTQVPPLHPDTVYAAICNFRLMQDNPQADYRIPHLLAATMAEKNARLQVPVAVRNISLPEHLADSDSALRYAQRNGYDVLFTGRIFEAPSGEQSELQIRGIFCQGKNVLRKKEINYIRTADSSLLREINDQANMLFYAWAGKMEGRVPFRDLADALLSLDAYSHENRAALYGRALYFRIKSGQPEEALSLANRLLAESRDSSYVLHLRSGAFWHLGKKNEAMADMRHAVRLDSSNSVILTEYGDLLAYTGRSDEAAEWYRKALAADSTNSRARNRLSNMIPLPDPASAENDRLENLFRVGQAMYMTKQFREADTLLTEYYLHRPDHKLTGLMLTTIALFRHDTAKALKLAREQFRRDSSDKDIVSMYATVLSQSGRTSTVTVDRIYQRARALAPVNIEQDFHYATFLYGCGQYARCADVAERARKTAPLDIRFVRLLAGSYASLANWSKAQGYYEYMNNVSPNDTNMVMLAQCYLETGDGKGKKLESGLKLLNHVIKQNPANAFAVFVMARYCLRVNDIPNARLFYGKALKMNPTLRDINLEKRIGWK